MLTPVVVGVDPSLSTTGVAFLLPGEAPQFAAVSEPPSRRVKRGEPTLTVEEELDHIRRMGTRVVFRILTTLNEIGERHPDGLDVWVVIEGPSHGSTNGKPHERAGLWWTVALALAKSARVMQLTPAAVKKYWTGNGNADKAKMMHFTRLRYASFGITDDNVNDAFVIAQIAAEHRGFGIEPAAPQVDRSTLGSVRWPEPRGEK